jgi:hypothetical protein
MQAGPYWPSMLTSENEPACNSDGFPRRLSKDMHSTIFRILGIYLTQQPQDVVVFFNSQNQKQIPFPVGLAGHRKLSAG